MSYLSSDKVTLGTLGAMRDALRLARQDLRDPRCGLDPAGRRAIGRVIEVIEAIVQGLPFGLTPEEQDRVAYKPRKAGKP